MTIINFTPIEALIGGVLIGVASGALLISLGKIFGISGIAGGLFSTQKGDRLWRFAMVAGLILGAFITHRILGTPHHVSTVPLPYLLGGSFLVGFGTRLGSGCTSGHGVCGNARLSNRSIIATLVFMFAGVLAATLVKNLI